jgi:hypothetical protein
VGWRIRKLNSKYLEFNTNTGKGFLLDSVSEYVKNSSGS